MSICQRADGRWVCKYKDGTLQPPRWAQRTFRTQADAEQFEDDVRQHGREGSRLTVFEAVALFLKSVPHCPDIESKYIWLVSGATETQRKARQKTPPRQTKPSRQIPVARPLTPVTAPWRLLSSSRGDNTIISL